MSENNTESSDTFIIVTKPETGFLWDQLSERERLDSLTNIMKKKLHDQCDNQSIDILVQTINQMYLTEYRERQNPINYKYSVTKTNYAAAGEKFRKILQETNWIVPIIYDRQKIDAKHFESPLKPEEIYAADLRLSEKKIREYHNNINSSLLQKLQNPYIVSKKLDTKIIREKMGPINMATPRKALWYVNVKNGKVDYSKMCDKRILIKNDKVYLDGVMLDPQLKNHFNFLKWYFSPNFKIDYQMDHQLPVDNTQQQFLKVHPEAKKRKHLVNHVIDQFNFEQLDDLQEQQFNPGNNEELAATVSVAQDDYQKIFSDDSTYISSIPLDPNYNIRKWPYFIIKFQDIVDLVGDYPLEMSKYDSKTTYEVWVSKDTRIQHLVYLIQKILTDLDVQNMEHAKKKLQSLRAEFELRHRITKGYCEREKCPSTHLTLNQVLENLTFLIDEYTRIHSEAKYSKEIKEMEKHAHELREHKLMIADILDWGIKHVYGVDVYNKILDGQKLTETEKKRVDSFLMNLAQRRKAYITNNCPHLPIRKQYDRARNRDQKMKYLDNLLSNYEQTDEEKSIFLHCKICGYVLGCRHEKLMLLSYRSADQKNNKYETELKEKFYANSFLDYLQNIISCRECGRKIKDTAVQTQVVYEKDIITRGRSIKTGHTVYSGLEKMIQSELTKILYYTNMRILYPDKPTVLFQQIEPVLNDDLRELEERLKNKKREKQKRQMLFVNAAIIGKLMFDSVKSDFNRRLLLDYEPVKPLVTQIQKIIVELKKHRKQDIKKYYVYHNQLIDLAIQYFIQLIQARDKLFVTKLGVVESKFHKIMYAYIKKYYQKFSDHYRFDLNKVGDDKVEFIRRGRIYLVTDIRYTINLPDKIPENKNYEAQIKNSIKPGKFNAIGMLNYVGEKKWAWNHLHVVPNADIDSSSVIKFRDINTIPLEVRQGIYENIPDGLIDALHNELWQYSSRKNKTRYQGKRKEIIFDLTGAKTKSSSLKYIDYNYLLYCPNGRPHLWIMKSSNPDEKGKICYWCHMTSQEAKKRTNEMTEKDYEQLKKNIAEQKIIEYFRIRCTDYTPHDFYHGYCLNCGEGYSAVFNPKPDRVKILKAAWEKRPVAKHTTVKQIQPKMKMNTLQISDYTNNAEYASVNKNRLHDFVKKLIRQLGILASQKFKIEDVFTARSDRGKEIVDKLFAKGIKNLKPIVDDLSTDLGRLGFFKRRYDDDLANLKRTTIGKEQLSHGIRDLKNKYRSEQVKELRNYLETFFQHISIIVNNTRSYMVSEIQDIDYLRVFIDKYHKEFVKFGDEFKLENFDQLFHKLSEDYKIKAKIQSNILHNVLIHDILEKFLSSTHTSLFVLGYLDTILYGFAQIGDRTLDEREFIDLVTEEKVLAKRLKFYKKLHEEKVEAGLAFADFEEQEAYFDAEKDTFQIENEDVPEPTVDQDIQLEDDIIKDINLDELDVDGPLFDSSIYSSNFAEEELIYYGNDL